jgi:glycosyl transferase, family 25
MDLAALFDAITIVNAAHRTDRRQAMRGTLRRIGLDPDGPKVTWFPAIDPKSAAGFGNPGTRGCFLSHVAILNIARNAGHQRVLILEDDCEFAPDFADRQAEVAAWLDSTPWDIAYLGHVEPISGPPRLVTWGPEATVGLTHCYAVTGNVLSRLSGYLEAITLRSPGSPRGGPMALDGAFGWFRRHNPDVQTVLVTPSLAHQRSSRSDLSPSWFDRVPVLREAAENVRVWRGRRRVQA